MERRETDEAYNSCLKVLILAVKDDMNRCEETIRHTVVKGTPKVTRKKGWLDLFTSGGAGSTDIKENKTAVVDKKPKTTTTLPPPGIGVLFGTHNWNSCGLVLKNLVDAGLAVSSDDQKFNSEAAGES
jgi:proline dehydrogenase